jgi:hypothetical protein
MGSILFLHEIYRQNTHTNTHSCTYKHTNRHTHKTEAAGLENQAGVVSPRTSSPGWVTFPRIWREGMEGGVVEGQRRK